MNATQMKDGAILVIGFAALAAALYAIHKFKNFGGDLTAPVADFVGDAIVDWQTDDVEVLPRIVLPNGERIDASELRIAGDFTFTHGGVKYRMTRRRSDGDYDSERMQ